MASRRKVVTIQLDFHESPTLHHVPIGSMYGIYANIWGILMGSMLPYIA